MHAFVLATVLAAKAPLAPPPYACAAGQRTAIASAGRLVPQPLDQMPDAHLMRAVLLTVGPCAAVEERVSDASGARVWRIRPTGVADSRYLVPVVPPAK